MKIVRYQNDLHYPEPHTTISSLKLYLIWHGSSVRQHARAATSTDFTRAIFESLLACHPLIVLNRMTYIHT